MIFVEPEIEYPFVVESNEKEKPVLEEDIPGSGLRRIRILKG